MTRSASVTAAVALLGLLAVGCASRDVLGPGAEPDPVTSAPAPGATAPARGEAALALRVEQVGGFAPLGDEPARLPLVSVYADGRVLTPGAQIEPYPPPAAVPVDLVRADAVAVEALGQELLAEGLGDEDLGSLGVADATTTVLTLVGASGAQTTMEAYALGAPAAAGPPSATPPGAEDLPQGADDPPEDQVLLPDGARDLTSAQAAARERFRDAVDQVLALASDAPSDDGAEAYRPDAAR